MLSAFVSPGVISSRITPELNDLFAARQAQCLCHVLELFEK